MVYLRLTRLRSNTPSDVAQWTHEPNADNIDCSGEQKPDAHETGVTTASLLQLVHANCHLKEQSCPHVQKAPIPSRKYPESIRFQLPVSFTLYIKNTFKQDNSADKRICTK